MFHKVTMNVKVKIYPDSAQKEMFHKNFGCCRKVYNTVSNKYNSLKKNDETLNPTQNILNKLLMECKKESPYLKEVDSTSLQQAAVTDLSAAFNNFFKNPASNYPKFHSKRKTKPSFRQTIPENKKIINGNKITLRKYGDVKFRTSPEHTALLNSPNIKLNSITVTFDKFHLYTLF